MTARTIRAGSGYDDLAGAPGGPGSSLSALEQLRLGTGRDYQPEVVESLARVLAKGCLTLVAPG